jgi:hypothetical protein
MAYTDRWERVEESLGAKSVPELLPHLRVILLKGRCSDRLEDFRQHVLPRFHDTRRLIDGFVVPYGAAVSLILNPGQDAAEPALGDEAKQALHWLGQINNHDWVPPALVHLVRYHNQPARMTRFLTELERLAAYLMVCRQYGRRRQPRYLRVIEAIEQGQDLREVVAPIQLTVDEREALLTTLGGDLYLMQPTPRNYVSRRLDGWLAESAVRFDQRKFTVEHVLPRNPSAGSERTHAFTVQERAKWVHKVGNLALLTRDKNDNASNFDIATKKRVYFTSRGVTHYALTTLVLREDVWTPEVIERRQRELIALLREKWRL